jgi:outer membrane protein insertion porin family
VASEQEAPLLSMFSDNRSAVVQVRLAEGDQYFLGKISLTGNTKTRPEVILREMKITTGEPYNPELVRQSEEDIELLGLFTSVDLVATPAVDQSHTKNIAIVVQENKPGVGEVGLGGMY